MHYNYIYGAQAIFSGSALGDVDGHGYTLVYPGVCHAKTSPHCLFGTTVNFAQPSNSSDPLSTHFTKRNDLNPVAQINGTVGPGGKGPPGGGGDSSAPFKTASGEWRMITRDSVNNTIWGSTDFFRKGSWYEIGPQPGFTQGACPSFFPAPRANASASDDPDDPTHVYMYSKTTLPYKCCSHRSVMVAGRYVDRGPRAVADWTPVRPFQVIDNGSYYAAKDFWDPVQERRVVWGWAQIPNGAQALPRTVTWHTQLRQFIFSPLPELIALRAGVCMCGAC